MQDKLFSLLAEQLGVEPEDIHLEDSLRAELHMNSVDLAELAAKLEEEGFGAVDLSEIETVEELLEALNVEEL